MLSGTIEFRLFQFADPSDGKQNGLHAGELKAYIQLCLATSQLAKMVKTASPKPQQTDNEKYAMRCWMLRLGFIGDEFKTAREILLRNMVGNGFCFRNLQPGFGNKSFAFRVHLDAVASMHERRRIAVTRRRDGARIELIPIDEQRLNLFGHQNVLARNPGRTAYDEARCPGTDVLIDHRFVCAVSARGEDDAPDR